MLTWATAVALLLGAPALKDRREPAEPPVGEWSVERLEVNGHAIVKAPDGYTRLRITRTAIALVPFGSGEEVAFFAADRGHAAVDYYPGDPKKLRKGIWKLDGDTLTICEAGRTADRPNEFTAPEGSKRAMWVLKRVKKE
jgi:uncharacterized protein (TIGR03067 family)